MNGPRREEGLPAVLPLARPGRHIPALDGVRGLAILLVLLSHGAAAGLRPCGPLEQLAFDLARWGWVGVDLFFVLSGFLITGILLDTRHHSLYLRNFYARRALRILPLHAGLLLVCLVLLPLVPHPSLDGLRRLADRQGWFWLHLANYYKICLDDPPVGWLSTLWSLSVEEHFYLLWPFVVWKLSPRHLAWLCVAGAAGALALRLTLAAAGFPGDYLYRSTPTRLDPLLLGALVALLVRRVSLSELVPPARAALIVGTLVVVGQGLLCGGASGRDDTWLGKTVLYSAVGAGWTGLLVLVLHVPPRSTLFAFFTHPALRFLGKHSYAMYLLNKPLFRLAAWLVPVASAAGPARLPGLALYFALGSGLTLLSGLACWHLVERHFLALKRPFAALPARQRRGKGTARHAA